MVKHIILWKLNDGMTAKEQQTAKMNIKTNLEGLVGKIDGLTKMNIRIDKLDSSSADIMMESEFINEEALKDYQKHPNHVEVANTFVRPNVSVRLSMDYQVD